jgi:hypothetical protein
MAILFGTQVAEQSNEHRTTLCLTTRFAGAALPKRLIKAYALKPEAQAEGSRVL